MTTPHDEAEVASHDLLACPFCGSDRVRVEGDEPFKNNENSLWVRCIPCDADGPIKNSRTDAVAAWNRRANVEI